MTTKLTDRQLVLLSTASQREDGNLLPPPDKLANQAARIRKAIQTLLKRALVEEAEVADAARVWRQDGDIAVGLVLTAEGRIAIGEDVPPAAAPAPSADADAPRPGSKIAAVVGLLRRDCGATLAEMVAATGWLPHTTRAALTGLRKKGHTIERGSRDGAAVYTLAA